MQPGGRPAAPPASPSAHMQKRWRPWRPLAALWPHPAQAAGHLLSLSTHHLCGYCYHAMRSLDVAATSTQEKRYPGCRPAGLLAFLLACMRQRWLPWRPSVALCLNQLKLQGKCRCSDLTHYLIAHSYHAVRSLEMATTFNQERRSPKCWPAGISTRLYEAELDALAALSCPLASAS